jgi:lysophospholipase L1-like esterase
MPLYRHSVAVERGPWYRVDTASGGSTPVTVVEADGVTPVPNAHGLSGSTVRNRTPQGTAEFYSSTATLYLKMLDYKGAPRGDVGVVTSTGKDLTGAAEGAPGGDIRAALAALPGTYVPRRQPIGHVAMGDSITAYQTSYGMAWHRQLGLLSRQTVRYRGDVGTSGYTLAQGESTLLPTVLAITPRPEVVTIALGTNDVGAVGYSFAESQATHARIRAALESAGITPGLWTIPPRDDSTTVNGYVQQWNAWIWELHRAYGYPIIDAHSALVDPATGLYRSTLKLDNVHPNQAGHLAIAQAALADTRFTSRFRNGAPPLSTSILTQQNLVTGGGLFNTDTNADGLADGLSKVGTPSLSTPAATYGKWQRISLAQSTAPGSNFWRADVTGVQGGRTYEVSALVHVDLESDAVNGTNFSFGCIPRGSGSNTGSYTWCCHLSGVLDTYAVAHRRFTTPAGTDTLRFDFVLGNTPTTRAVYGEVSQFLVRDVTDLTV